MTAQEAFDRVLTGIRRQNYRQSVSDHDSNQCVYVGKGNDRCAIGHLLPESVIKKIKDGPPSLNECPISTLKNEFPELKKLFWNIPFGLLDIMQSIHDNMKRNAIAAGLTRADLFERQMLDTAKEYGLVYTDKARDL